jgi:hypothetical protein
VALGTSETINAEEVGTSLNALFCDRLCCGHLAVWFGDGVPRQSYCEQDARKKRSPENPRELPVLEFIV